MATILKAADREFLETANKPKKFRVSIDSSAVKKGVSPENLNFELRQLAPGKYSGVYHFHRYAEEMFMILEGSALLRSPEGLHSVGSGDILFFEKGENGAHQLYNHTQQHCNYFDIRTFIGFDVAEYPDSDKIFLVPSYEIFDKNAQVDYFDGEQTPDETWKQLREEYGI